MERRTGVAKVLETLPVADAKKHFSRIVRQSSEALKAFRVGNRLRKDAPRAWILGEEAVGILLSKYRCRAEWEEDVERGLWTVYVPELDIFGQGATKEEAVRQLLDAAKEYAGVYLNDVPFYIKVGRRDHYAYVLAVALAEDDPGALRAFLGV